MTKKQSRRPSRDKVIPKRRGGIYSADNTIIVCTPCNTDKGGWPLVAFHAALLAENDHRTELVAAVIAQRKAKGLPF